jgi:DNA-binding transcriptional LysR family regulator
MLPRTTAEQWAVLAAVVDEGGFAQAAARLSRSQSAVSYTLARLQEALQVPLLELQGRKAVLTPNGSALLKRARPLLRELQAIERMAGSMKLGWEPQLRLAVDAAFPRDRLLAILAELQGLCPQTDVQFSDEVLSGAEDAILESKADVVVTTLVPPNVLSQPLFAVIFIAVAQRDHPLLKLGRTVTVADLATHPQVVVRDSGTRKPRDEGWLNAHRRCTVSSMDASLATVQSGLAYAWLPEHLVQPSLDNGTLQVLPIEFGSMRSVPLHLVLVHPELAGPAAQAAVECFQRHMPLPASGRLPEAPGALPLQPGD